MLTIRVSSPHPIKFSLLNFLSLNSINIFSQGSTLLNIPPMLQNCEIGNTSLKKCKMKKLESNPLPLTEETTCGIWIFNGVFLQKFANKRAYVFLYGMLGCIFGATSAYFNGTITTLEKRFKIPSRTTGSIFDKGPVTFPHVLILLQV